MGAIQFLTNPALVQLRKERDALAQRLYAIYGKNFHHSKEYEEFKARETRIVAGLAAEVEAFAAKKKKIALAVEEMYRREYSKHFTKLAERETPHAIVHRRVVTQAFLRHFGIDTRGRLENYAPVLSNEFRIKVMHTPINIEGYERLILYGYPLLRKHCSACKELCDAFLRREYRFLHAAVGEDEARDILDNDTEEGRD